MPSKTELFLDDSFIEWISGATRKIHQPAKHILNPVLKPQKWWEARSILPNAVMYDKEEKIFKMWYRTGPVDRPEEAIDGHVSYSCYATSADGINWDRPELRLFEMANRKDHNIVLRSEIESRTKNRERKGFILSVIKHPHPEDESEKYVCMFADMGNRGCYLAYSPDGIHWKRDSKPFWQTPVDVTTWGDDTVKSMIYDHFKRKWVIYRRVTPEESERLVAVPGDEKWKMPERVTRVMGYADSSDLKTWENHRIIMMPDADDPPDTEFYGLTCYNYAQIYIGYLWTFHTAPENFNIDIQLVCSRNGVNFTRCCRRETYLNSSPVGSFDYLGYMGYMPEPIILNDTVYLFYGATNVDHGTLNEYQRKNLMQSVGLATLERYRFVCIEASGPVMGYLVTKPFVLEHPYLHINLAAWDGGSIKTSILTGDWKEIQGFASEDSVAVSGNVLDQPIIWKNKDNLSSLIGRKVRLKFHIDKARLYAFTLDDVQKDSGQLKGISILQTDTSPNGI